MDSSQNSNNSNSIINIYPCAHYYFGSKNAVAAPIKDATVSDRIARLKSNYAQRGMRTNVQALLLVEMNQHPYLLLLQVWNSVYKLPGGRLRPGESDVAGLQRKLSKNISNADCDWKVGECIGMWWRSDFDTLFRRNPANAQSAKECTKLYIVHLPKYQGFTTPKYLTLIAVPLRVLPRKTYGHIISEIPQLLSKFTINAIWTHRCCHRAGCRLHGQKPRNQQANNNAESV